MQNFLGNSCPYCGNKFTAEDDIVVCPECGTPHHRECYKEHGICANEDKHSETFEWKDIYSPAAAPKVSKPEESHIAEGSVICFNCGTENPADSRYCLKCGAILGVGNDEAEAPALSPEEEFQRERESAVLKSLGEDIGGITAKEALIYVKTSGGYFLPRFKAFSKGMKFDTNFSAFIFSFLYLFYRKMYKLGFAVLAATLILSIPTALLDLVLYQEMLISNGMLSQLIWEIPHQDELAIFSFIASTLIFAMRFSLMIFFNKLYYNRVVNEIKEARVKLANSKEEDVVKFFKRRGGTSLILPIVLAVLYFGLNFAISVVTVLSEFFIIPDTATTEKMLENLFKFW